MTIGEYTKLAPISTMGEGFASEGFLWWNESPDDRGFFYEDGEEVFNLTLNGRIDLYAIYGD